MSSDLSIVRKEEGSQRYGWNRHGEHENPCMSQELLHYSKIQVCSDYARQGDSQIEQAVPETHVLAEEGYELSAYQ